MTPNIYRVVLHFQIAAEHFGGPAGAGVQVEAEIEVFAVAGPVLDHPWFIAQRFPAVVAAPAPGRCCGSPSGLRRS